MQPLSEFFKSIIDSDNAQIVICDKKHTIVYMNRAAIAAYSKRGGESLVGQSIFSCHNPRSQELIIKVTQWFEQSENNNKVHTFYDKVKNKDVYMVALRNANKEYIGYYEKHEYKNADNSPFYLFE